ncbi:MAG: phosphotransferase [Candidatus Lokiarchaeota archaeon]|nr:phosphotransferase [Candidatus Lokiarchaeota archaeon]
MNPLQYHGHTLRKLSNLLNESLEDQFEIQSIDSTRLGGWSNINLIAESSLGSVVLKLPAYNIIYEHNPYTAEFRNAGVLHKEDLSPQPLAYGNLDDSSQTPFFIRKHIDGIVYHDVENIPLKFLSTLQKSHKKLSSLKINLSRTYSSSLEFIQCQYHSFKKTWETHSNQPSELAVLTDRYLLLHHELVQAYSDCSGWKTQVIHGDFQETNIIFHNQQVSFIDVGSLCKGSPLFDIAYLYSQSLGPIRDYSRSLLLSTEQLKKFRLIVPIALFSAITWTLIRLLDIESKRIVPVFAQSMDKIALKHYLIEKISQVEYLIRS